MQRCGQARHRGPRGVPRFLSDARKTSLQRLPSLRSVPRRLSDETAADSTKQLPSGCCSPEPLHPGSRRVQRWRRAGRSGTPPGTIPDGTRLGPNPGARRLPAPEAAARSKGGCSAHPSGLARRHSEAVSYSEGFRRTQKDSKGLRRTQRDSEGLGRTQNEMPQRLPWGARRPQVPWTGNELVSCER